MNLGGIQVVSSASLGGLLGDSDCKHRLQSQLPIDSQQIEHEVLCRPSIRRLAPTALDPAASQTQRRSHQMHGSHRKRAILHPGIGAVRFRSDHDGSTCARKHLRRSPLTTCSKGMHRLQVAYYEQMDRVQRPTAWSGKTRQDDLLQAAFRYRLARVLPYASARQHFPEHASSPFRSLHLHHYRNRGPCCGLPDTRASQPVPNPSRKHPHRVSGYRDSTDPSHCGPRPSKTSPPWPPACRFAWDLRYRASRACCRLPLPPWSERPHRFGRHPSWDGSGIRGRLRSGRGAPRWQAPLRPSRGSWDCDTG